MLPDTLQRASSQAAKLLNKVAGATGVKVRYIYFVQRFLAATVRP